MTGIFSGSLEETAKAIGALLTIIGPSIGIYLYFPAHGITIELTIQYIIDYVLFIAILYIFILLNRIDKKLPQ